MKNINEKIQTLVDSRKIFIFMNGTPYSPACDYSQRAIDLLKLNSVDIESIGYFNALDDKVIKDGVKVFSSWPTIPQLYVSGVFIGGSDMMLEMNEDGELSKILA